METPIFLLHILVAYLESFPKYYNIIKLRFIEYLPSYGAWKLPLALSMYACACERIFTHMRLRDLSTLLGMCLRARNWVQSFSIEWFILSSFFRIAFSFNFFTLMSFFKAFFKMTVYSSNEIVDLILVFGEAG